MSKTAKILMVSAFLLVCGGSLVFRGLVGSSSENVQPSELCEIILRQFEAMRAQDFWRAYQHVSFGMQQRYDLLKFSEKARADFGAILRCKNLEIGYCRANSRHARLQVYFIDARGLVTPCIYSLVRENEEWKVDGVRFQPRWQEGRRLTGTRA